MKVLRSRSSFWIVRELKIDMILQFDIFITLLELWTPWGVRKVLLDSLKDTMEIVGDKISKNPINCRGLEDIYLQIKTWPDICISEVMLGRKCTWNDLDVVRGDSNETATEITISDVKVKKHYNTSFIQYMYYMPGKALNKFIFLKPHLRIYFHFLLATIADALALVILMFWMPQPLKQDLCYL